MLRINSVTDDLPGGPVSVVSEGNEILGREKTIHFCNRRSTSENLASSRAQLFAIAKTTARKVLQHCVPDGGASGVAGLE
jgi:hypothetical protein